MRGFDVLAILKTILGKVALRFKPLTAHTESIYFDDVWNEIKKKVILKKIHTWYLMTPANYELFKAVFGYRGRKKNLSKIMKERYLWMKEKGERLQLHIHLSLINNLSYREQDKMFKESLDWMKKELNIVPTEFVAGWWIYNKETLKILKKYNLKLITFFDYDSTHDYNWVL